MISEHDDKCTAIDRTQGRCYHLSECSIMVDVLKTPEKFKTSHSQVVESIRKSKCGYDRNNPLVCCPGKKVLNYTTTTQSSLKFFSPIKTFQQFIPVKVTVDATPISIDFTSTSSQQVRPSIPSQQQLGVNHQQPLPSQHQLGANHQQPLRPSIPGQQPLRPSIPSQQHPRPQFSNVQVTTQNHQQAHEPVNQLPAIKPALQANDVSAAISNNNNNNLENPNSRIPLSQDCGVTVTNHFFRGNKTELDDFPWTALLEYETCEFHIYEFLFYFKIHVGT